VFSVNVKGLFLLSRALLPLLKASATATDPARIVNIGSIDGIRTTAVAHYAYSASKAAVHQMTRVLASELAEHRITVNAIAAGPFHTKMLAPIVKMVGGEEGIASGVPLKRLGAATDVAGLTLFLCSPAGAFVSGTIIPLDGGILCKPSL